MSPRCTFVSFRLGMTDGVSVVADSWQRCFRELGWDTVTVAADGPVDRVVPGLGIDDTGGPDPARLRRALADADLVVAENILTIPLNLDASRALVAELAGRPTILHHHDPPWQRDRFAHIVELPPDDPAWHHVTINRFTEQEFADRGLAATTIYNGFDTTVTPGDRAAVRTALGVTDDETLVVHPVRAIARKNVPAAVELTTAIGGVYWLPGPAEEGYEDELDQILSRAGCRVLRSTLPELGDHVAMADAYAACDLVVFPSLWEGFGNPPIEAALHRRPAAVGHYPAAEELRLLGFQWLEPGDPAAVRAAVDHPDELVLDRNRRIVEEYLGLGIVAGRVKELLDTAGFRS